jgi:hypothetical protein
MRRLFDFVASPKYLSHDASSLSAPQQLMLRILCVLLRSKSLSSWFSSKNSSSYTGIVVYSG